MMKKIFWNLGLFISLCLVFACSQSESNDQVKGDPTLVSSDTVRYDLDTVKVTLEAKSGSSLKGTARFINIAENKILLQVNAEGIDSGKHGVHIHQNPDCSAADASSAGGHWNPSNDDHGSRSTDDHHAGDIGNLVVDSDGTGMMKVEVSGWTVGGPKGSNILDRAIVIHAGEDDLTSQPSGDAGSRVGCGVIQK